MQHVVVSSAGALIVLVILPRWIELGQFRVEFVIGWGRTGNWSAVRRVEGQRWRAFKWRTHDRECAENVRPDERRPRGDRRAGVVAHYHRDGTMAERVDKADRIAHHIKDAEWIRI